MSQMDIFYLLRSEKSKHGGIELLLQLRFYNVRTKISNMFSTLAYKNPKHFFSTFGHESIKFSS